MNGTMILGVGAQKAGTTWFYQQLVKSSGFNEGFGKEYHFFDSLFLKECKVFRQNVIKRCRNELVSDLRVDLNKICFRRLSFYIEPSNYFDYFTRLLNAGPGNCVADITPSYSGLSEDHLRYIRDEFEQRNVRVVPLFLMREPVNRLNSMVRHHFREKKILPTTEQVVQGMHEMQNGGQETLRSDYTRIYSTISEVFGIENCLVGFYETIFSENELRRLFRFLQLDYQPVDFTEKVNASPKTEKIERHEIELIKGKYQDRYDFVLETFGQEFVDLHWHPAVASLSNSA